MKIKPILDPKSLFCRFINLCESVRSNFIILFKMRFFKSFLIIIILYILVLYEHDSKVKEHKKTFLKGL